MQRSIINKALGLFIVLLMFVSCKDEPAIEPAPVPPVDNEEQPITPGLDPALAKTIGFFADEWTERSFAQPEFVEAEVPASATVTVTVDNGTIITKIPPTAFGQNANTWMTRMVDQGDFMKHITNLHPRIIRFPAGSGSDACLWT